MFLKIASKTMAVPELHEMLRNWNEVDISNGECSIIHRGLREFNAPFDSRSVNTPTKVNVLACTSCLVSLTVSDLVQFDHFSAGSTW